MTRPRPRRGRTRAVEGMAALAASIRARPSNRASLSGGRWALPAAVAARACLLGDADDGRGVGLDDGVAVVAFDGAFDLDDLVARHDDESPRVGTHGGVLARAQADQLVAAEPPAFAAEADELVAAAAHRLVEPAQGRLVERDASLADLVGGGADDVELHRHGGPRSVSGRMIARAGRRWLPALRRLRIGSGSEPHADARAVRALVDPQLVADVGDDLQAEPEARAVGARRQPDAPVADHDPDAVVVDVERHAHAPGLVGGIAVAVRVDDSVGDRLRDGQVDGAEIERYRGDRGADRVAGARRAARQRGEIEIEPLSGVARVHARALPDAARPHLTDGSSPCGAGREPCTGCR